MYFHNADERAHDSQFHDPVSATVVRLQNERQISWKMEPEQMLIDLSYLTEEERERLVAVIKADQELRTRDRIRLG